MTFVPATIILAVQRVITGDNDMERKASSTDFDTLYQIYMDEVNNPFMTFEIMERSAFRPVFDNMLAANDLFVYEIGGKVAATYRIQRKTHRLSHVAYFGSFAIHPEFRGKGHGKMIMREVVDRLRKDGVKRLELLVVCDNERAIRFYTKRHKYIRMSLAKTLHFPHDSTIHAHIIATLCI